MIKISTGKETSTDVPKTEPQDCTPSQSYTSIDCSKQKITTSGYCKITVMTTNQIIKFCLKVYSVMQIYC